jgi:hypothetical protein
VAVHLFRVTVPFQTIQGVRDTTQGGMRWPAPPCVIVICFFQVIYPLSHADMRQQGRTDEEIIECLRWAQCSPEEVDGRADLQFVVEGKVQILKCQCTRNVLFRNVLCIVTRATRIYCIVTNVLCKITNVLCIVTNVLCIVTNVLCIVTIVLRIVTNVLCIVTNVLCTVTRIFKDTRRDAECKTKHFYKKERSRKNDFCWIFFSILFYSPIRERKLV